MSHGWHHTRWHHTMDTENPVADMEDLSYDEEQVHLYLLKHIREAQEAKEAQERERLRVEQDDAYRVSEAQDRLKGSLEFEEASIEEMRRVRLLRFGNPLLKRYKKGG